MNSAGRVQDFNLDVDPYKFLGIQNNCRDMKEIKKAYRKKVMYLHPDKSNSRTTHDFSTLNKCYIYLKTLCQELQDVGSQYAEDLEDRMRNLRSNRIDDRNEHNETKLYKKQFQIPTNKKND